MGEQAVRNTKPARISMANKLMGKVSVFIFFFFGRICTICQRKRQWLSFSGYYRISGTYLMLPANNAVPGNLLKKSGKSRG
jgi:hypothetical protein